MRYNVRATVAEMGAEDGLLNDALTAVDLVDDHAHVVAGTDDAVPRGHRVDADSPAAAYRHRLHASCAAGTESAADDADCTAGFGFRLDHESDC